MRIALIALLLVACPAFVTAQERADTFEVVLPDHRPQHMERSLLLEADGFATLPSHGLVELKRGSSLVGLFQSHNLLLIANRSAQGSRTFEVQTHQGSFEIVADRMQSAMQNGPIVFWVDEEPVAVVSPGHVLMIIDRGARV